jgi:hypothetical protein
MSQFSKGITGMKHSMNFNDTTDITDVSDITVAKEIMIVIDIKEIMDAINFTVIKDIMDIERHLSHPKDISAIKGIADITIILTSWISLTSKTSRT